MRQQTEVAGKRGPISTVFRVYCIPRALSLFAREHTGLWFSLVVWA